MLIFYMIEMCVAELSMIESNDQVKCELSC